MNAHPIAKLGLIFSLVLSICVPVCSEARSRTAGDPGGHTNRGVHYARDKKYDKAIEEFGKAIDAQPNYPKNYRNRAQAYRLNNQPNKALSDYNKLIELEPKDAEAYAALGQLEVDQADYNKGLQHINRALELEPTHKNLPRFRAFAYLKQKQWKKAAEDYNVVVKDNPRDLEALEARLRPAAGRQLQRRDR